MAKLASVPASAPSGLCEVLGSFKAQPIILEEKWPYIDGCIAEDAQIY